MVLSSSVILYVSPGPVVMAMLPSPCGVLYADGFGLKISQAVTETVSRLATAVQGIRRVRREENGIDPGSSRLWKILSRMVVFSDAVKGWTA